jgi:hypothetical protein
MQIYHRSNVRHETIKLLENNKKVPLPHRARQKVFRLYTKNMIHGRKN